MRSAEFAVQVAFGEALEAMRDYPCPKARQAVDRLAERCGTHPSLFAAILCRARVDGGLRLQALLHEWPADDVHRATGRTADWWLARLRLASDGAT